MRLFRVLPLFIRVCVRDRTELALQNLALRQQLAALRQKSKRPGHLAECLLLSVSLPSGRRYTRRCRGGPHGPGGLRRRISSQTNPTKPACR